ncbi:FecCD family ABC transporter permease [Caulobacter sp. KR2-114]|uniref:FecCD family ABC transporter permease n=1 Tax=Caulobacter sp. KR2-114 TaxID=3400912 RepID=UPI003C0A6269
MSRRSLGVAIALAGLVALLAAASLMAGKVWAPFAAWTAGADDPRWAIVFQLRIPRTVLGVLVGAALGLSGAALQGYTRNPLADPGVLGVSAMAAFGAVMTLYLGLTAAAPWVMAAAGMAGAMAGVAALLALAGTSGGMATFVLAGVILNTVASAGVALALNLAPNAWAAQEIIDWLMGSLADRSMTDVSIAAGPILAGCAMLLALGRALDALTLGETGARSLGVDLGRTRVLLAVGVGLACGASVAVTGVVSFVGLVVPHLLRPWVGQRPAALLLPSALGGAALVLAADILVRLTPSAAEVKLGVAMAALGGPFFLMMLVSMRRRLA